MLFFKSGVFFFHIPLDFHPFQGYILNGFL